MDAIHERNNLNQSILHRSFVHSTPVLQSNTKCISLERHVGDCLWCLHSLEHQLCQGGQCSRGTTQAARLFALFLVQREATTLSGRATVMSRQRRQRVTAQRGSSAGRRRRRAALTQRIRNIGTTLSTFLDAQFLIFVFFSFLETDIELKKSYLNNIIFGSQVV